MSLSTKTSLIAKWSRRFAPVSTSFHLWCAERELRVADTRALAPALRQTRARNLDLLRAYRRRGEFPDNTHDPTRLAPCFVDSGGRQCAVAFLMDKSGAKAAVEQIVREANHARIGEMRFSKLETWASGSGLTKTELARIQPGYMPTPEEAAKYAEIILAVWFVGALAVNSILFNTCRLIRAHKPRLTTMLVGVVLGIVLLFFGFQIDTGQFWDAQMVYQEVVNAQLAALGIGVLSVVCGIIPLCVRRGKWRPTVPDSEPTPLSDRAANPPSEHVQAMQLSPRDSGIIKRGKGLFRPHR